MTEQTEELTDQQKADLAEQERKARSFVRIQNDEAEKAKTAKDRANLGKMSNPEYRKFVREQHGYDPGV